MSSSLAAQLVQIATTSTNQLDLKAQRAAHSQSLIFEKQVAAAQTFDTIFQICDEGFQELCSLDSRFRKFRQNVFSEQSKTEDRLEMNASQNKELDSVLEEFLGLVGARLLLTPAVKAVDWLVRRFRIHEYNTSFLLLTFLPYHTTPLFLNLLSILPEDLTPTFKALQPYKRSLVSLPRYPIVQSAATNKYFFAALNDYVLQVCKAQAQYQGLISFWAGITTEAVASMLDSAKSGRIEIERRNKEDVLLRILPVLHSGFSLKKISELVIGCYMLCVVITNKGALEDNVIDSLMEAVAGTWNQETLVSGMICLSVLAQHRTNHQLRQKVVKSLGRLENAVDIITELSNKYSMDGLLLGLVSGCTQLIQKRIEPSTLSLVEGLLHRDIVDGDLATRALTTLMRAADKIRTSSQMTAEVQTQFSNMLLRFKESDRLAPLLQAAIHEANIDTNALELSLETVIENDTGPLQIEDVEMDDATDTEQTEHTFASLLESVPRETKETYFLQGAPSAVFKNLAEVFIQAVGSGENLSTFTRQPILKRSKAMQNPLYISFFLRLSSGPYPPSARAMAISMVKEVLVENSEERVDVQFILPYIISTLADPSERVRREAVNLLATFERSSAKWKGEGDQANHQPLGSDVIYGDHEGTKGIQWLSVQDVYKVTHRALLPGLEEYVLDASQIGVVVEKAIRGSSSDSKSATKATDFELKKNVRQNIFTFLCSHTVNTPLYAVKLRLLNILNRTGKVSSTSRTQELLPLLKHWQQLQEEEVQQIASNEQIDIKALGVQILTIVSPKGKSAVEILTACITPQPKPSRPSFVAAVFNRLKEIWASLKEDSAATAADSLLQLALGSSASDEELRTSCKDLLRSVDISGPILVNFMDKVSASVSDIERQAPASKRRRTSQNNMVAMRDPSELGRLLEQMTFILEIVDGSNPENHPELIGGLFRTLAALHHLKMQVQSEMSYLLSLLLGILLAIINKVKQSPKSKWDTSAIRADLIVDCVRVSSSPQVQNTAILLVAGLAKIAPELVLHSVMPIFTFMGSNVLKKDDEYSAAVIDQTIDQVIPPLIQSLRNQKRDVVSGTSELLLSFTAAFEHMPSHRRLRLFDALITRLGPEDFLFAVFAMLANRYSMNKDVLNLMTSLAANVNAELQLSTYTRYLSLVQDCLQPKPVLSRTLLGIGGEGGRDAQSVAVDLLQALSHLLRYASLGPKMEKIFESEDSEHASTIHKLFSRILEQTLGLSDAVRTMKPVSKACGDVLGSVLNTLSLVDFLDTIEVLLRRSNDDLRRKVLRLLESRLDQSHERGSASQTRVLEFLATLIGILESSPDILLKHAAVACIERIADKYGRKDPGSLVAAAKTISSEHCIGQSDNRLRVMGVLCLASMSEVLKESIIPVLPEALRRSFDLLRTSLEPGKENTQLHDAVYSFICSILIQIPWMISGDHLDGILQLSFKSAKANLPEESDENRHEALQLLAKKVDTDETFRAVDRNWSTAVSESPKAVVELVDVAGLAITKHPKSSTVKNVPVLIDLLYKAFDVRRTQFSSRTSSSYAEDDVDVIETHAYDVAIKMIYKLNDTVFRPLFIQLTDWATKGVAETDTTGRLMRLTTFYKFLGTFFGNLKSIVTSYSTFILDSAVDVLNKARLNHKDSKNLWLATMQTLQNSFEHDQDEFWQSPSHLNAICTPLTTQLGRSTNASSLKLISSHAIPTIVELAAAADSPDNYKEINTAIMKYMRSGTATGGDNPHTRLAAVKCEVALTERLGEEWLALLPEMLPYISELMEDEDEGVEREVKKWILAIEEVLGEKLDDMLM
ncbi:hypothetical protein AJ80_09838 [Polytolypa hystricis UAMH7299]|uniref:U3 small nucleolar RNA-associated protein 10 n=1 Tax=Polytolypa hystricis (strain UAMH7299) TaxID=1447883 RepID=A0A2B7WA11_POLH7|nr:hypothetical protein AJ80_09838 [Polytolypa hystricis UAMH7299]